MSNNIDFIIEELLESPHLSLEQLQWIADNDDRKRPLSEREISMRMVRVSGDCVCPQCGKTYYKHEYEKRVMGWENRPYLKWLCNGILGKL